MAHINNKSGFTLLELVTGIMMLVVALIGVLSAFSGCFTLNETARNITISINGTQEKIEQIRELDFSQVPAMDGTTFEILQIRDDDSEGVVEVDDSDPEILRVTATVCWRQKAGMIFGEDSNLNGVLDGGEDINGNNQLDSPAQITTIISERLL
ncbi:MAG: hypothetical protein ABH848_04415 [Candidatus Omnitrophota bacterium]